MSKNVSLVLTVSEIMSILNCMIADNSKAVVLRGELHEDKANDNNRMKKVHFMRNLGTPDMQLS